MKINYFPKQKHFARKVVLSGLIEKKLDFNTAFVFHLFWLTNMKIHSWEKYLHSLFRELGGVFILPPKTQQVIIS